MKKRFVDTWLDFYKNQSDRPHSVQNYYQAKEEFEHQLKVIIKNNQLSAPQVIQLLNELAAELAKGMWKGDQS